MGTYQITPDIKYYVDEKVAIVLNKKKKLVLKKDRDFFFIVDGDEGAGKSYLAFQLAKFLDPSFGLSQIAFTGHQFLDCIKKSKKGQSVVFDEAFTGLSARASLSEINKLLIETIMEVRKKNLFIFIVLPSVFYLDRYVVLARARVLFHAYFKRERRGQYSVYDKEQIKWLMLKGRKTMSYSVVRPRHRAKFSGRFALDKPNETIQEENYSKMKSQAIENKGKRKINEKQTLQRNLAVYLLYKNGFNFEAMVRFFEKYSIDMMDKTTYYANVNEWKKREERMLLVGTPME